MCSKIRSPDVDRERCTPFEMRSVVAHGTESLVCSLNVKAISSPSTPPFWNWRNIVESRKTLYEKKNITHGKENEQRKPGANRAHEPRRQYDSAFALSMTMLAVRLVCKHKARCPPKKLHLQIYFINCNL